MTAVPDITIGPTVSDLSDVVAVTPDSGRPPSLLRTAFGMWRTRIGAIVTLALVLVAVCGRYFAPYGESEGIGVAQKPPGDPALRVPSKFGTGYRGTDVWSTFLYGGRPILFLAVASTLLALVVGTVLGLAAAYSRGRLDDLIMRTMDIIMSFPQIIAALLIFTMFKPTSLLMILTVGLSTVPRIARVVRGSAVSIVERDFVGAAEALGESRWRILRSELLPNVAAPLLVEANLRLTFSIGLIAGIAFLGFTPNPLAANWGLMIDQNREGLLGTQAWGTILPVAAIAALTIGTGLIGDGLARAAAGIDRAKADS